MKIHVFQKVRHNQYIDEQPRSTTYEAASQRDFTNLTIDNPKKLPFGGSKGFKESVLPNILHHGNTHHVIKKHKRPCKDYQRQQNCHIKSACKLIDNTVRHGITAKKLLCIVGHFHIVIKACFHRFPIKILFLLNQKYSIGP